MTNNFAELVPRVTAVAAAAGEAILSIYQHDVLQISTKDDATPLTQADTLAHQLIVEGLSQLTPGVPILSEEGQIPDFSERQRWSEYWLVDPVDGTKEFIGRTGEFSVNIALIVGQVPVLGVIVAPTLQTCYYASRGLGAFKQAANGKVTPLVTRPWSAAKPLVVAVSRRHQAERLEAFMARLGDYTTLTLGSSLKFCAIAAQEADLYPRLGPTSEWDTGAGHCILTEAGGAIVDLQGLALTYNTKDVLQNPSFMATGDLAALGDYLSLIQETL